MIHKAVGWMPREVGKRDVTVLEELLAKHCRGMLRTMLRYVIERFPEEKRRKCKSGIVWRQSRLREKCELYLFF